MMSMRAGWTYDGKHFCQTRTERGGQRYFIDGKPTTRATFLAERTKAAAREAIAVAADLPE